MPGTGAAGVLLFVDRKVVPIIRQLLNELNAKGRVSEEVLSLHLVQPQADAVARLTQDLCKDPSMTHVENLHKLKPNNGLKDLVGKRRLHPALVRDFMLVVGIETVTEKFRSKYPNPNLTLQAGSIEKNESALTAAIRELSEEARVVTHWTSLSPTPIRLLGGGLVMYPCQITSRTLIRITRDYIYIGRWSPSGYTTSSSAAGASGAKATAHRAASLKSAEHEDLL